jgi:multicomponent Na+:H+ antiporter subunit A
MKSLIAVLSPLAGALLVIGAARRPRLAWALALSTAAITTATTILAAARHATFRSNWIPSWRAEISLEADALGSLFAILAAAIGLLVLTYSRAYIPHHIREHDRPRRHEAHFCALLLLFLCAMIGLAYARDLILLFVFFELTAVCSYLLIAFDRDNADARRAALTALIVTGATAVALLIAALLWFAAVNSFDIATLRNAGISGSLREWCAALVLLAALAKSAQVPFHFWLPRAMAAPTPVSAYLHSAAMVAAGMFLLLRLEPLLTDTTAHALLP